MSTCRFTVKGWRFFHFIQWSVGALQTHTLFDFCHSCALLHTAVASDDFCIGFGGDIQGIRYTYSSVKLGSCEFARSGKFPDKE